MQILVAFVLCTVVAAVVVNADETVHLSCRTCSRVGALANATLFATNGTVRLAAQTRLILDHGGASGSDIVYADRDSSTFEGALSRELAWRESATADAFETWRFFESQCGARSFYGNRWAEGARNPPIVGGGVSVFTSPVSSLAQPLRLAYSEHSYIFRFNTLRIGPDFRIIADPAQSTLCNTVWIIDGALHLNQTRFALPGLVLVSGDIEIISDDDTPTFLRGRLVSLKGGIAIHGIVHMQSCPCSDCTAGAHSCGTDLLACCPGTFCDPTEQICTCIHPKQAEQDCDNATRPCCAGSQCTSNGSCVPSTCADLTVPGYIETNDILRTSLANYVFVDFAPYQIGVNHWCASDDECEIDQVCVPATSNTWGWCMYNGTMDTCPKQPGGNCGELFFTVPYGKHELCLYTCKCEAKPPCGIETVCTDADDCCTDYYCNVRASHCEQCRLRGARCTSDTECCAGAICRAHRCTDMDALKHHVRDLPLAMSETTAPDDTTSTTSTIATTEDTTSAPAPVTHQTKVIAGVSSFAGILFCCCVCLAMCFTCRRLVKRRRPSSPSSSSSSSRPKRPAEKRTDK